VLRREAGVAALNPFLVVGTTDAVVTQYNGIYKGPELAPSGTNAGIGCCTRGGRDEHDGDSRGAVLALA